MIHFIGGKGRLHKGTVLNLRSCMRKRDSEEQTRASRTGSSMYQDSKDCPPP